MPSANTGRLLDVDLQKVASVLQSGELSSSNAIGELATLISDLFVIIRESVGRIETSQIELKQKQRRSDALVSELKDRLVGLQQQLLIQEERYDESRRHLERYKVICQLQSTNAADLLSDEPCSNLDLNNNDITIKNSLRQGLKAPEIKQEMHINQQQVKSNRRHAKLARDDLNSLTETQPYLDEISVKYENKSGSSSQQRESQGKDISSYYLGSPVSRKPLVGTSNNLDERRFMRQISSLGGISAHSIKSQSMARQMFSHLDGAITENSGRDRQSAAVSISGSSNEVLSSSRRAAAETRARSLERDLHRQVAWPGTMRLASRRVKNWPF